MNDKNEDRRVRKTKQALRQGLAVLMAQKNINDITVKELTDLVDINRGTFYFHYKDIFDFSEQIENEIIEGISSIINQIPLQAQGEELYCNFFAINQYIAENHEMAKMFLCSNANSSFLKKMRKLIGTQLLPSKFEKFRETSNDEDIAYYMDYQIAGYIAVLSRWLENDMPCTPEQLASKLTKITLAGVNFLRDKE